MIIYKVLKWRHLENMSSLLMSLAENLSKNTIKAHLKDEKLAEYLVVSSHIDTKPKHYKMAFNPEMTLSAATGTNKQLFPGYTGLFIYMRGHH